MSKRAISLDQRTSLRYIAAAIAVALLSLPLISFAQAQDATKPGMRMPPKNHHYAKHRPLYDSARDPAAFGKNYMMQDDAYTMQWDADPWTPNEERPFPDRDYYGSNGM